MSESVPRCAAIDYGRARIGVAVSDDLGILAHPRPFVPARPPGRALRLLVALLREEGVGQLLIGLPLNMDGSEGLSARRALEFASSLGDASGLPVEMVDERLTTVEAHSRLQQAGVNAKNAKSRIDSASAALMLQGWLDARAGG